MFYVFYLHFDLLYLYCSRYDPLQFSLSMYFLYILHNCVDLLRIVYPLQVPFLSSVLHEICLP